MNKELLEALNVLEKEKEISKDTLLDAIETSLLTACKNHFGKADNVHVSIDRKTCDYELYMEKEVVEEVEDPVLQISLEDAKKLYAGYGIGDTVRQEIKSKEFGRIATQNAKNVILQKIREEERKAVFDQFHTKEHEVVTGIVQRYIGRNISVNLGKADAMLNEVEQVKGETYEPTERIKVLILEVKDTTRVHIHLNAIVTSAVNQDGFIPVTGIIADHMRADGIIIRILLLHIKQLPVLLQLRKLKLILCVLRAKKLHFFLQCGILILYPLQLRDRFDLAGQKTSNLVQAALHRHQHRVDHIAHTVIHGAAHGTHDNQNQAQSDQYKQKVFGTYTGIFILHVTLSSISYFYIIFRSFKLK